MAESLQINHTSGIFTELNYKTKIINDLLGGTQRMRQQGEKYLFKMEMESKQGYLNRLNRSTLYPALSETLSQMVGRVFYKPINTDNCNERLNAEFFDDVDLMGNNLDVFANKLFYYGLAHGVSYCLIDFTKTENSKTQFDDRDLNARPYLSLITAPQVLGLKTEVINGKRILTQFRFKQIETVQNDDFTESTREIINLFEIGRFRQFATDEKGAFQLVQDVQMMANGKPLSFIPIVAFITKQGKAFYTGEPPLMELAYLNIKHWQSQSDQDNILNTARVPLLARIGVFSDEPMQIGGSLIDLPENGDLKYIEHSGNAIQAGLDSLKELELQMKASGAKLLDKTTLAMTVEQSKDEQAKEVSILRLYANKFEDCLDLINEIACYWWGISADNVGNVEISGNIDNDLDPSQSMETILKMQQQGILSNQTVFNEAKRRALISDNLEWETEQELLEQGGLDGLGDF